jgi:glutamine amidotransferase
MCRFTFYKGAPLFLSALLTEPAHSLIHQSFRAEERDEPLNGDGFGVAWYVPEHEEPALFRSVTPAWSNYNLRELARVTQSGCVLAHVRAATQGLEVGEPNCHPFRRGRVTFMHNGDIGGFAAIRRPLLRELSDEAFGAIRGTTDSEHFFALLCDALGDLDRPLGTGALAAALRTAVARVGALAATHAPGEHTYLNAVVTDGEAAVAVRYTTDAPENADSLYLNRGRRYVCEGGVCRMLDPGDEARSAVMVSSEPLSTDGGWEAVPVNQLVHVEPDLRIRREALALPGVAT